MKRPILTLNECRIVKYALRNLISQFAGKEDFNPEDWIVEQKEQRAIRRLLKELERGT